MSAANSINMDPTDMKDTDWNCTALSVATIVGEQTGTDGLRTTNQCCLHTLERIRFLNQEETKTAYCRGIESSLAVNSEAQPIIPPDLREKPCRPVNSNVDCFG